MKFSKILGILTLALLLLAVSSGSAFAVASGCRSTSVQSWDVVAGGPAAATQTSGLPGEYVTIAIMRVLDNDAAFPDPSGGVAVTTCPAGGVNDGVGTEIAQVEVKWVNGVINPGDVDEVVFFQDTTPNGLFDGALHDTVLASAPGSVLASPSGWTFSTGGNAAFNIAAGGNAIYGVAIKLAATPGANFFGTVSVNLIPDDNAFPTTPTISSRIHPLFQPAVSLITLVGPQIPGGGVQLTGYGAGSGRFESTINRLRITNIGPTRQFAVPDPLSNPRINTNPRAGDNDAILAIVAICEGGSLPGGVASLLPFAPPQIAGGLAAIPCVPNPLGTDGINTKIEELKFRFEGAPASGLGAVTLYINSDNDAFLMETPVLGDTVLPGVVSGNMVRFGNTGQVVPGFPAAGIPDGAAAPRLLVLVGNLSSNTPSGILRTYLVAGTRDNISGAGASSNFVSNSEVLVGEITVEGVAGPTPTATLVASVGKPPRRPSKTMTYKDVFVSATGPAGASRLLTNFSVPGCTVSKVKGPALPVNVTVGGAPVGPFTVKVKCPTKPGSVPGLTPLRVGESNSGVPSLIPLKAGSVGTVEIYTLTGKKVLETGFSGGALDATKLDLPNGVYLYVVKTITPEGVVQSELRKLVVKN
ncbi:MAG: T9SS type A sorting domain-containing protein [Candidatus Caldarchaeum sp.]